MEAFYRHVQDGYVHTDFAASMRLRGGGSPVPSEDAYDDDGDDDGGDDDGFVYFFP